MRINLSEGPRRPVSRRLFEIYLLVSLVLLSFFAFLLNRDGNPLFGRSLTTHLQRRALEVESCICDPPYDVDQQRDSALCPNHTEEGCPIDVFGNLDKSLRDDMTAALGTDHINKKCRCPSDPLITGDGFRSLCKFRCESKGCDLDLKDLGPNDCIFFNNMNNLQRHHQTTPLLQLSVLDKLKHPIVLISHNSDAENGRNGLHHEILNHPKVKHWFTQNCNWLDREEKGAPKPKKLTCIPIGIENRYNSVGNYPDRYFEQMEMPMDRDSNAGGKMFISFAQQYPQRKAAHKHISSLGENALSANGGWITYNKGARITWMEFAHQVRHHKFTLSPQGHGLDCHRTWEVLLLGGVPVVKSSSLDSLYDGLPVVIFKEWKELTEDFLVKEWEIIKMSTYKMERIFFAYWKELIQKEMQRETTTVLTVPVVPS